MNLQSICRVCINPNSDMISIFESYNFTSEACEIFKVIVDCAAIQIQESDGFSVKICQKCLGHLSQAYTFKKLCKESDYKFRNNLIAGDNIEIKNESYEENNSGEIKKTKVMIKSEFYDEDDNHKKNSHDEIKTTEIKKEQSEDEIDTEYMDRETPSSLQEPQSSNDPYCTIIDEDTVLNHSTVCNYNEEDTDDNTEMTVFVLTEVEGEKCNEERRAKKKGDTLQVKVDKKKGHISYKIVKPGEPSGLQNPNKTTSHSNNKKSLLKRQPVHVDIQRRLHSCHICNQKFLQASDYIRHMTNHSSRKVYPARKLAFVRKVTPARKVISQPSCCKNIALKKHSVQHMRVNMAEIQLKCPLCEKKFTKIHDLEIHVKLHVL